MTIIERKFVVKSFTPDTRELPRCQFLESLPGTPVLIKVVLGTCSRRQKCDNSKGAYSFRFPSTSTTAESY